MFARPSSGEPPAVRRGPDGPCGGSTSLAVLPNVESLDPTGWEHLGTFAAVKLDQTGGACPEPVLIFKDLRVWWPGRISAAAASEP